MAAAFLRGRQGGAGGQLAVASAGLLPGGLSPPPDVVETMAAYGFDLRRHRSRRLTAGMLGPADLVLGMARRHIQEAILLDSSSWPRAFTVKEFVRRAEAVGPRDDDVPVRAWSESVHEGRTRAGLVDLSAAEEVADPFGGPPEGYRRTGAELAVLVERLHALLRPAPSGAPRPPMPVPELDLPETTRDPGATRGPTAAAGSGPLLG